MALYIFSVFFLLNLMVIQGQLTTPEPGSPYCQPNLCPKGAKHVACEKFPVTGHRSCDKMDMRLVNMTEHMDKILKFHNELRHRLALGKDTSLPRAARLVAMLWSNDLAEVAGFNVRMCLPRHDECRNTPNFTRSGQNIIVFNMTRQVEEEEMNQRMPELLSITTQTWWAESANITMENLEQYPCDGKQQNPIRHFAEMAIEGNSHVGCAGSVYLVRNMTQLKLTCNYARSPVCGQPIFRFRPLGCKSRNRKHLSLCSPTELFP